MTANSNLQDLLEPGAEALGFEILAVELAGSGAGTILRVYIDGPEGIGVEDCAQVSHQLSAILDVEDPIPGHYTLEVSSPGLDRPLSRLRHFEQAVGQRVRVKTHHSIMGRRRFTGLLDSVEGEVLIVNVDDEHFEIPIESVSKARLLTELSNNLMGRH